MKSIRQIALITFLTLGVFSLVTYTSCTKDDCRDITCKNGGTCTDGVCSCPTGYEGVNCQTTSSAKFLGTYLGTDQCSSSDVDDYAITIAVSDNGQVTVSNIYNQGFTAFCTVTGTKTFSFSGSSNGNVYGGNGTINGSQLILTYNITSGPVSIDCKFTGTSK